jgi:methionine-gamma-lyase
MLSFEVADAERAGDLLRSLGLIRVATSLGGPDTLMCHPASTTHAGLENSLQEAIGVTPGLLRISVGLEHPDDLIGDLDRALAGPGGGGPARTS